jgi:hypothetical protein
MHHVIGTLVIGALGGMAFPRAKLRPAIRGLVKGGIAARRRLEEVGTAARTEVEKLVDEARADLDRPAGGPVQ